MQTLSRLSRVARTVRYLKMQQIAGQIHDRIIRPFERYENTNGKSVEAYPGCAWPSGVRFLAPGTQENRAETIRQGTLRFLNCAVKAGFPPRWDCPELSRLWQYNLHYFEWLWALDYEDAKLVVLDWIERHLLTKDAVGWEPYPTSLRLVNWCAVFFGRFRAQTEADHGFLQKLWVSLVRQAQWLRRHLETHLLGNHYLENGAALAFVGSCFVQGRAERWFEKGHSILREQIAEQILPDGMHFELSPMYHCRMMYVLALLMATGNGRLQNVVADPLQRMSEAMNCLCHTDGRIALLNDSAFGVCNEPDQLRSFCTGLPADGTARPCRSSGCFALPEAGYYGWRDQEGNHVICDFGRIGPDYIPGHAHSDLFSFELSLRGRRVIVDTGVHDYEASEARRYCRSTAAHNTVEIDGCDQCEMWGAFRVAQRGYPQEVQWRPSTKGFRLSGWHNGYARLRGRPVHYRTIEWHCERGLTVTDRITSSRSIKAVSRLHLHPACAVSVVKGTRIDIEQAGERVGTVRGDEGTARIEAGWYFPQFGLQEQNEVLAFAKSGTDIKLSYHIGTNV
jgi:uncharacterized heparinase superfamily protein